MKEFLTFKSGKFYFTVDYDKSEIEGLLIRAIVLHETIVDLPIPPDLTSSLVPNIMYSSIAGTAAIEGNAIPEEDVKLLAEGKDVLGYSRKDKQEINNLIAAYSLLDEIAVQESSFILEEELIKKLHQIFIIKTLMIIILLFLKQSVSRKIKLHF